jgi:hypothetical protein
VLSELAAEGEQAGELVSEEPPPQNLFSLIVVDAGDPSELYAVCGQGLLMSSDYGANWAWAYRDRGAEVGVTAVAVLPERLVLATGEGLQLGDRAGRRWESAEGIPARAAVSYLVSTSVRPQRLYAVVEDRAYRSDDSGSSWVALASLGGSSGRVRQMSARGTDPDVVYLATEDGVWVSHNGLASVEALGSLGLRTRQVTWLEQSGEGRLLLGTRDGVYQSTDEGQSWSDLSSGVSAQSIAQVRLGPDQRPWLASGDGIYERLLPEELTRDEAAARRAIESWADEPDLGDTLMAALRFYGYEELAIEGIWARLSLSRFLPDVRLYWNLQRQRDETQVFVPGPNNEALRDAMPFNSQEDETWRLLFLWNVEEMLFDGDEVSARDVSDRLTRRREDLIRRVVRVYERRQALMLRMATRRRASTSREVTDQLELEELTARLDVLTGGYFSAHIGGLSP